MVCVSEEEEEEMLGAGGFQLTKLHNKAQSVVRSIHSQERGSALEESTITSNVERFLESVTPSVPAHHHYLSNKVCFKVNTFFLIFIN